MLSRKYKLNTKKTQAYYPKIAVYTFVFPLVGSIWLDIENLFRQFALSLLHKKIKCVNFDDHKMQQRTTNMKKVASKQSFSLSRSYMTNPSNQHENSHDIGKKARKRNWKPFHAICHQVTMTFFPRNNFHWEKYGSQRFLQT